MNKHKLNSDIADPYREVGVILPIKVCTLRLFSVKYVDKHTTNITKYIYYSYYNTCMYFVCI